MRDFSVVWRMDLFVCVFLGPWPRLENEAQLARAGNKNTLTLSHTHVRTQKSAYEHVCTHTHTQVETTDCLQGQTDGSAASPTPLISFSIFPPISLSLSVWACHLSALTLSSLPSLSLLHRHVSGLQVPSYHITSLPPPVLFPSFSPGGSTLDLLAWPFAPTLPLFPVTPAANLFYTSSNVNKTKNKTCYRKDVRFYNSFYLSEHKTNLKLLFLHQHCCKENNWIDNWNGKFWSVSIKPSWVFDLGIRFDLWQERLKTQFIHVTATFD